MKLLSLVFFVFAFCSCVENNDALENEDIRSEADPLVGKWQLVETSYSIGGPLISKPVEDGPVIIFQKDGTYISDRKLLKYNKEGGYYETDQYEKCTKATYNINDNFIELNFECESGIVEYVEVFNLEDEFLIISPYSPTRCIEGCPSKYKRIK